MITSYLEFTVRVLKEEDGVVTGIFTDSLLLSLPPCSLEGQNVSLAYNDSNNKSCKYKHHLVKPTQTVHICTLLKVHI